MPGIGFNFFDPALMAASQVTFDPDLSDAALYGWWGADYHISRLGGGTKNVTYTAGNRATYQVDKTDRTTSGCTNLVPRASNYEPRFTRDDNLENLVRLNEDMTSGVHVKTNCTANSATLVTFTAQNGSIKSEIWRYRYEANTSYVISAKLRNVSGNTALEWITNDSTYTSVAITGSSVKYSLTFTTPAVLANGFYVGIRDPNAAGHGQLEILELQVRKATTDNTYLANPNDESFVASKVPAKGTRAFMFHAGDCFFHFNPGVNVTTNPWTMYLTVYMTPWENPDRLISMGSGTYDFIISQEPNTSGYARVYTTGGTPKEIASGSSILPSLTWKVITVVCNNGGTSQFRTDLNAALTGSLNDVANSGIPCWPGDWADSYSLFANYWSSDLVIRHGIDDAATQEKWIKYLGGRVGLSL